MNIVPPFIAKLLKFRGYKTPKGEFVPESEGSAGKKNEKLFNMIEGWYEADNKHRQDWIKDARKASKYYRGKQKPANFPTEMVYVVINVVRNSVNEFVGIIKKARQEVNFEIDPQPGTDPQKDERNWRVLTNWIQGKLKSWSVVRKGSKKFGITGVAALKVRPMKGGFGFIQESVDPLQLLVNSEARDPHWDDRSRLGMIQEVPLSKLRMVNQNAEPDKIYQEAVGSDKKDRTQDTTGRKATIVEYEYPRLLKQKVYRKNQAVDGDENEISEEKYLALDEDMKATYEAGERTDVVWWVTQIQINDPDKFIYMDKPTELNRSMYSIATADQREDSPWADGLGKHLIESQDLANVTLNVYLDNAFRQNRGPWKVPRNFPVDEERKLVSGTEKDVIRYDGEISRLAPEKLPEQFLDLFELGISTTNMQSGTGPRPGHSSAKSGKQQYLQRQEVLTELADYGDVLTEWVEDAVVAVTAATKAWLKKPLWVPLDEDAEEGEKKLAVNVEQTAEGDVPFQPANSEVTATLDMDLEHEITLAEQKAEAMELWKSNVLKDPGIVLRKFEWEDAAEIVAKQDEDDAMRAIYEIVMINPELRQQVQAMIEVHQLEMQNETAATGGQGQ